MTHFTVPVISTEYLSFAFHYILYKRAIYPHNLFVPVQRFGMSLMLLEDDEAKAYIADSAIAIRDYMATGSLLRVVLNVVNISTNETVESWNFTTKRIESDSLSQVQRTFSEAEIQAAVNEAAQVLKQIGVSFLPALDARCSFRIILISEDHRRVPDKWRKIDLSQKADNHNSMMLELRKICMPGLRIETSVVSHAAD